MPRVFRRFLRFTVRWCFWCAPILYHVEGCVVNAHESEEEEEQERGDEEGGRGEGAGAGEAGKEAANDQR